MDFGLWKIWSNIFMKESLETNKSGYINSLSRSMCLAIEEFYNDMNVIWLKKVVDVSSITGHGFGNL